MVEFVYTSNISQVPFNMTKNWRVFAINYKGVPVL